MAGSFFSNFFDLLFDTFFLWLVGLGTHLFGNFLMNLVLWNVVFNEGQLPEFQQNFRIIVGNGLISKNRIQRKDLVGTRLPLDVKPKII